MANSTIYCLDANFFINLKDYYFFDIFVSLKENLEKLAKEGRIVIHKTVLDELARQDDDLFKWVKANISNVVDIDEAQIKILPDIINKNTKWYQGEKTPADPFIIALAETKDYTVITSEKVVPFNNGANNRIPAVCQNRGIKVLTVNNFFKIEGWSF